jgi:hypothetical protein
MVALSYEDFLAEIQALLGEQVSVVFVLELAGHQRPVGMFSGELRLGQEVDLRQLFAQWRGGVDFPSGEAILFFVGDEMNSCFVVRRDDFKHGSRDDNGLLAYRTGKLSIGITRADG